MPARLAMHRCRVTGRRAAVGGCQCIACTAKRDYGRQWQRDQAANNTAYYRRMLAHRRREPLRSKHLDRLEQWKRRQSKLAVLLYDSLRHLARRDARREARASE